MHTFSPLLPKAPGADVCRLIYAPLNLTVTSPGVENSHLWGESGNSLMKYMDTAMKDRKREGV